LSIVRKAVENAPEIDTLTPDEAGFIALRDTFYMATVSETGWPYVQHRDGPSGFVKVLGPDLIGSADFKGNRQLVSTGNMDVTDRLATLMMDYPHRTRRKLLGHARQSFLLENHTTTASQSPANKKMITDSPMGAKHHPVHYNTIRVNELDIFYREAGPENAPTILLLHGFPTSSNMFRNLTPRLAQSFHVVAPDYPGFGQSSMPSHKDFSYSFENLTNVVEELVEKLGLTNYSGHGSLCA
jgi:predicted pyridoxine 5'-phosphate oxidase superfamily flavin-nucleotide-binding protein